MSGGYTVKNGRWYYLLPAWLLAWAKLRLLLVCCVLLPLAIGINWLAQQPWFYDVGIQVSCDTGQTLHSYQPNPN